MDWIYNYYGYLDFIARGLVANDCEVKSFAHKDINPHKLEHKFPLKRWREKRKLIAINNAITNTKII